MSAAASDLPLPQFASRSLAMMAHLSTCIGFFLSIPVASGLVLPAAMWVFSHRRDAFVHRQAREALNFHLTVLLVGLLLTALPIPPTLIAVLVVGWLALVITIAGLAYEGRQARYPAALPILRRPRRISRG